MPTTDKAFKWRLLNLGAIFQLFLQHSYTSFSTLFFSKVFIYLKIYIICYNYLLNFLLYTSNY